MEKEERKKFLFGNLSTLIKVARFLRLNDFFFIVPGGTPF